MFVSIIEKFWSSKVEGTLGLGGGFQKVEDFCVCFAKVWMHKNEDVLFRNIFEQYFNYNIIADFLYSMALKR